ncbi:MAG: hypothetical protein QOI57_3146, partial [Rubrobacteraceae bacterium]|nr:hypothetical protein [Rubrobacteraceae bacterium]
MSFREFDLSATRAARRLFTFDLLSYVGETLLVTPELPGFAERVDKRARGFLESLFHLLKQGKY